MLVETVNGIDIFEMDNGDYYMLKKGWATIGCYFTIEKARQTAKNS